MGAPGMDLRGRRVAVVGLGKSGVAAARFCAERGAIVTGTDDASEERLAAALAPLSGAGVALRLGGLSDEALGAADLVVLSPGVPPSRPPIAAARARGAEILGEIELAARFIAAPVVGVTGTNGKSTVASLCGAIAERTGRPSFCGGNLGTPLIEAVGTPAAAEGGIVVCELSSFQLETVSQLRCAAAAVLNLTPDHLDRYPSLAAYGDAKARVFRNMAPLDTRVVNADDAEVAALLERSCGAGVPVYPFTTRGALPRQYQMERHVTVGGFVDGGDLVLRGADGGWRARVRGGEIPEERYPIGELQIIGRHNLGNALAALLLMRASGLASYADCRAALSAFRPLRHRMELVCERGGVRFYDDSKGTNVDAVIAGLDGFPRPFALIAGGRDKGGSYAPLREVLDGAQVRGAVLIGEAAPLIEAALSGAAFPTLRAGSMEEAVRSAAALCGPGDAVVLSPACSSFDMFRDYAHRADVFLAAARALPEAGRTGGEGA